MGGPEPSSPPLRREKTLLVVAEALLKGEVEARHDVVIEGRVEGRLAAGGTVLVPEAGSLEAEVYAERIVIRGRAVGRLSARRSIEVAASAEVSADLTAPEISLADGASFSGTFHTAEAVSRG